MEPNSQEDQKNNYQINPLTTRFILVIVCIATFAVFLEWAGGNLIERYYKEGDKAYARSSTWMQDYKTKTGGMCSIATVKLQNYMMYATDVAAQGYGGGYGADVLVKQIEQAKADKRIKGVLLAVDSPGGSPLAGEMIANALKNLGKPSAALIYDFGDSAAYFASTGASVIIASPFSSVGDIGITSSYVDYSSSTQQSGGEFVQLSAGEYKDAGNPDKPLTKEEKQLLQKNVDEEYQNLIRQIATNRNLSTSTVKELANGAAVPGSVALEKKLIDMLGDLNTARDWFTQKIGSEAVFCE